MEQGNRAEKIIIRYYSKVLGEETTETLWATVMDPEKGLYQLDNIPFFGPPVACGDIVFASFDEREQMLTHRGTYQDSGNSVIQVMLMQDIEIAALQQAFEQMGCPSEGFKGRFLAMEIPAATDYGPIRKRLQKMEKEGIIEYAEPHLSKKHAAQ